MITRRALLKALLALGASGAAFSGYAYAETFGHWVQRYRLTPEGWPEKLKLRVAILADIHACDPWMSEKRIQRIVDETNQLNPDIVLLLGDYIASYRMKKLSLPVSYGQWATPLSRLKAPLGVHAVLGNHDWWDDKRLQERRRGPVPAALALEAAGIPVYENDAIKIEKDGQSFWIAGLGDQWSFWPRGEDEYQQRMAENGTPYRGVDDLDGLMAKITDDSPVILMAHEPDIFPNVPKRVALTVSGHTHGGQVRVFGYAPIIPSRFGSRYLYGHIVEDGHDLVVSAGLGCSGLPIRIGAKPEITVVELGGKTSA